MHPTENLDGATGCPVAARRREPILNSVIATDARIVLAIPKMVARRYSLPGQNHRRSKHSHPCKKHRLANHAKGVFDMPVVVH